jgi:dolichyl-phosphate mannosyltransferase polypeptide 2 regulatory subunit
LQPFLPSDHPLNEFFLAREWAFRLPAFLIVVGISAVAFFIATVLRNERRKQERKRLSKAA